MPTKCETCDTPMNGRDLTCSECQHAETSRSRHVTLASAARRVSERAARSSKGAATSAFFARVAKAHDAFAVRS